MNTNGLKKLKVIQYIKRVGKVSITELSRNLGISKSWGWEILNKVYKTLLDKLKFGYRTVYYILKSCRKRFSHYYFKDGVNIINDMGKVFKNNMVKLLDSSPPC